MTEFEDNKSLQTRIIRKKVKNFFWFNIIPFLLAGVTAYLFYKGEIAVDHFPEGTEKLLWLSVLSAGLMATLSFLTFPFSVWLRRSAKKSLQKAFPAVTGEQGFFLLIFGIPLLLFRVLMLFLTWCFHLIVIALIAASGLSFLGMLGYAIYKNIIVK